MFLPAFQLAQNSKVQASTGAAPHSLVYGTVARLPIDSALDGARPAPTTVPAAAEWAEQLRRARDAAFSKLELAQARQKRLADRSRRSLQLKEGDRVLLGLEGLRLRSGTHKLTGRYLGPFRVLSLVNDNAIRLDLPPLLRGLHPVVNISRLKLYRESDARFQTRPQRVHRPPAVDTDTNGVGTYEVESVLAQRGTGSRRELLVRWLGYGPEDDEWQPYAQLNRSAPEAVANFQDLQRGAGPQPQHLAALGLATDASAEELHWDADGPGLELGMWMATHRDEQALAACPCAIGA